MTDPTIPDDAEATRQIFPQRRPDEVTDVTKNPLYQLQLSKMENRRMTDVGLLLLRIGAAMLVLHGLHKALGFDGFLGSVKGNWFGATAPELFAILVVAGQLLLPVALLIGLFTRLSGLLLAVLMFFIGFIFVLPNAGWIDAKTGGLAMESALLYLVPGLALFFTGAGRYSVDWALGAKRRQRRATRAAS